MKIKLPAISDKEAEEVDYVVCARASDMSAEALARFDDNFTGNCARCGHKVIYRWHMPRKPKKLCMVCACEMMEQELKTGKCDL